MSDLKKILESQKDMSPSALVFSEAGTGANDPYMIRVTKGQWDQDPSKKTLVIQVTKRSDIDPNRAVAVAQHALQDVFGADGAKQAYCEYRNVHELKKRLGKDHIVDEPFDTMTIIFNPGPVVYTRKPSSVHNRMAAAFGKWHVKSETW